MQSAGFKEWAIVCEAMGCGEQCAILRKGGLAEGRDGFAFRHSEFFLFPTWFHEQLGKVRGDGWRIPEQRAGEVEIRFWCKMAEARLIESREVAEALGSFHILDSSVVRERFEYDSPPGLHVGLVRVFRLEPVWVLADSPRYGGCRSWVTLPAVPAEIVLEPVLSDEEHEERVRMFREFAQISE